MEASVARSARNRDLAVGLFILAALVCLGFLSLRVGGLSYSGPGGLELYAIFDDIGGLSVRSPVVISGVKVGQVTSIVLDEDLRARVSLDVDARLKLPIDSSAGIRTSGLLGDQFVALVPGAEEAMMKSGETVSFTESALNLDRMIGSFVHGDALGDED